VGASRCPPPRRPPPLVRERDDEGRVSAAD